MAIITIDKFAGGIHASTITSQVQQDMTDCEDALNVEFYPRGTISQRDGYKAATINAAGSGMIRLYRWKVGATNYQLAYTCTSGTGASATSACIMTLNLGTGAITNKVSAGAGGWNPDYDDAIDVTSYCNSAIATYQDCTGAPANFNGTTAAAQTTMSSGCACIEGFGNYLFIANYLVGGIRKGSRLAWSSAAEISSWPADYYIDLDADDGDQITAMKLLGDYLVVFKKKKIFVVYWVGGSLLFKEARRSVTVGCVGPNTVVEHEGKLIFLAEDGVYSFDGTVTKELSIKVRPLFQSLNPTYYHLAEAHKYPDRKQIWFSVPYNVSGTTVTSKNYIFVWDFELNNWTKFDISCSALADFVDTTAITYGDLNKTYVSETRTFGSYATRGDEKLYVGFLNGKVHQFGEGTSLDDTTAIHSRWKSIWLDLQNPIINKRLTRMTFLLSRKAAGNLLIDLQEDWKDDEIADASQSWTGTKSASMTGTTAAALLERRVDSTRSARAFQIVLSGDSSGNPWSVHKIMLDILEKGRTLV
jgi:hypothetical protein